MSEAAEDYARPHTVEDTLEGVNPQRPSAEIKTK